MARKQSKIKKCISYIKKNWPKASIWLFGAIVGLLLTKACNMIWPDAPVVVKEHTDTVKVIHSINPLPNDSDSIMMKQIEHQLMTIELLDKYEKQIKGRSKAIGGESCKMILGNPYRNCRGYTVKSSSSFCLIDLKQNSPFIDVVYSFLHDEYPEMINTLGVKISSKDIKSGRDYYVLDQNYEPQRGKKKMLVRIVDDMPSAEYVVEAGFILKEDSLNKFPPFYRQTFVIKK